MSEPRPNGRSARVRAAVLEATLDELATGGVHDFSVEAVAIRAGVHKTSIYRRWGRPTALIADAINGLSVDHSPQPDLGSLRADLFAYADRFRKAADDRAMAVSAAIETAAALDADIARIYLELLEHRVQALTSILERARDRGELDREVDPRMLLTMLFGALGLLTRLWNVRLTRRLVATVVGVIVDGVTHSDVGEAASGDQQRFAAKR